MIPLGDRNEIIVVNESLALMRTLRKELSKRFSKIWIMLHCDESQKIYGIELTNVWGGKLEHDTSQKTREFIENFMIEKHTDHIL